MTVGSRLALLIALAAPPAAWAESGGTEFFETRIRPLLAAQCVGCHSVKKNRGGLMLDSPAGFSRGGDTGSVVVPNRPDESLLVKAVRYGDPDLRMPPKGKLSADQVADLERWVASGAVWPADRQPSRVERDPAVAILDRAKLHWAFQPLTQPEVPSARSPGSTPVDAFIASKLERAGLAPAKPLDRAKWLRRVTFDLVGLPPTPEELRAFDADSSPGAESRVVERLLANPHYGERWGRHWLDLARYAETRGHEFDFELPHAWRYRDYVVRAFNADLPYDQFLTEQLAGDLVPQPRRDPQTGANESVVGTGFFLLGEAKHSPVDLRVDAADRTDNSIDVFAKTFLGLTVSCARCHDHKFDPVLARDYYALSGLLKSSRVQEAFLDDPNRRDAESLAGVARARAEFARVVREAAYPHWLNSARADAGRGPTGLPAGDWLTKSVVFADFARNDYSRWYATGEAFGQGPTRQSQLRWVGDKVRVVPAGRADSGAVAGRLQGVLRSATFTIDKPHVAVRAAGRGGDGPAHH